MKSIYLLILLTAIIPVTAVAQNQDPYSIEAGWSGEGQGETIYSLNEYDLTSPNYESAGAYLKRNVPEGRVVPYPYLREADVAWAKRYERIIDARQKMNLVMLHPKTSLTKVLMKAAYNGTVPIYATRDFDTLITPEDVIKILRCTTNVDVPDENDPTQTKQVTSVSDRPWEEIVKFRIIEEWIFDKKHSMMIPRIIAIAPIYTPMIADCQVPLPEQAMFWLKYDDLRPTLVNSEVFNRGNSAGRISYDHLFQARMFDSYIVKEPNALDLDIKYYPELENDGLGQLLESEKIKNDLFVMEHDLWEY